MRGLRGLVLAIAIGAGLAAPAACTKTDPPNYLQAQDLVIPEGGAMFDPSNLISDQALGDSAAIDTDRLLTFFGRTPYDRPTFLETAQSNGVRAADAIIRSARLYKVNPIVFVVWAQMVAGLVGERDYPRPGDRFDYAFRCGCSGPTQCDPRMAGFDIQVDCLGNQIRSALDNIDKNGSTAGGWSQGNARTSVDGVSVTPGSNATAAIYQLLPIVNQGQPGGTFVFWNLMQLYSSALGYFGGG
jgi:hypothetical protein